MNKHQSVYVNTIFLLLVFGLGLASLLHPSSERSETENRPLQQMPALTWESLFSGQFSEDYEEYLSDQFILRDQWITMKTDVERLCLKQDSNDVYFAADDYLIEKHSDVFAQDTAQQNIQRLAGFMQQMSERYDQDHLSCIIVPNAVDVLADKLPPFADPYDEEIYLEKIRSVLPQGVWVDASKILKDAYAKSKEAPDQAGNELYYRTDHHWKSASAMDVFAAWIAQKHIGEVVPGQFTVSEVSDTFEGTIASRLGIRGRADSIERYDPAEPFDYYLIYNRSDDVRNSVYHEASLDTRDQYAYFYGGNYGLIEAKMPDAHTGRSLLVIKDSYAHCFTPLTYGYFDKVDMLDPRYFNESILQRIEEEEYTDILFLFNAAGFAEETSIARLLA